jgi:hypothetical protein
MVKQRSINNKTTTSNKKASSAVNITERQQRARDKLLNRASLQTGKAFQPHLQAFLDKRQEHEKRTLGDSKNVRLGLVSQALFDRLEGNLPAPSLVNDPGAIKAGKILITAARS